MRSKLFVPASRPELFEKALRSEADAVCFDLEDAVLEHRKDYARECLAELFQTDMFRSLHEEHGKTIIVRVNPLDTPHLTDDLKVSCAPGVDILNIPKTDTADDVRRFIALLEEQEQQHRTHHTSTEPATRVLANVETSRALLNAADIAASHERVWGLQLGLGDLFEPLSIARYEWNNLHAVMFQLRIAAGTAGKIAYDSAYTHVANADGYRQEALCARNAGFLGKTCIHPSQVAIANEVFSPTEDEIRWAERIIESAAKNTVNGAYLLDGKMIDAPFIERAHSILAQASQAKSPGERSDHRSAQGTTGKS